MADTPAVPSKPAPDGYKPRDPKHDAEARRAREEKLRPAPKAPKA